MQEDISAFFDSAHFNAILRKVGQDDEISFRKTRTGYTCISRMHWYFSAWTVFGQK
ncbi:hypothetical protein [Spirosoma profusum]|uniref:hypothetical protein n=1 Tax=Spirosoma profusum TaxID=2771354 RepID=UPI001CC254BC|nr:hypothetical protein [Spirosoma profusum]